MSKAVFSLEPALELELEISETRFGLLPEDLFRLAVRQNTQRAFLFVSKVLGKHLPVEPAALLAAGKLLALAWLDQKDEQDWAGILKGGAAPSFSKIWDHLEHSRYSLGMEDRALFLGFAETATGLARAVADCFDGEMAYISTTRVDRAGASPLTFDEAHSHARTHRLYLDPHDPFMAACQQVVLVDDELTTGNTALRLIRQLHAVYGIRRFTLMVLVDNSEGSNRRAIEQELGIEIRVFSLLRGHIAQVRTVGIASPVPIRLPRCRWGSPCASLAARQRPFRPDLAKRQRSGAPARPLPVPLPLNWDRPHQRRQLSIWALGNLSTLRPSSLDFAGDMRSTLPRKARCSPWLVPQLYPASVSIRRIVTVRSAIYTMSRTMPTGRLPSLWRRGPCARQESGNWPPTSKAKGLGK